MDFFLLPKELNKWVGDVVDDTNHWVLIWDLSSHKYSTIKSKNDPLLIDYEQRGTGEFRIFFGNKNLKIEPIMRIAADGKERIDFRNSLCIVLEPPFIAGEVLIKGSINVLNQKEYSGMPQERNFILWRKKIFRSFKEIFSDTSVIATQPLIGGAVKKWRNLVISTGAFDWYLGGGKLKEFPTGPVEFVPIQSQSDPT